MVKHGKSGSKGKSSHRSASRSRSRQRSSSRGNKSRKSRSDSKRRNHSHGKSRRRSPSGSSRSSSPASARVAKPKAKRPLNSYNLYIKEQMSSRKFTRDQIIQEMKNLAQKWKAMTDDEKKKYEKMADDHNANAGTAKK